MGKRLNNGLPWHLLPTIFTLAWPTMMEQLMQTAVQYIDTAMVGSLGTEATAAVGSTSTVNWLVSGLVASVGVGFLAYVAKAFGANETKTIRKASAQATMAVLVVGTILTVVTLALSKIVPVWMQVDPEIQDTAATYFFIVYTPMLARAATIIYGTFLRASGDTKTPMRAGIWTNMINVVLNFLLIYPSRTWKGIWIPGAGMGIIGAAVASAIAFVAGGLIITVTVWRHPVISPRGQSLKPDMTVLRPCIKVAFPNLLQRFGTSLGYVAFAAMINSLGGISTAAHTIANTVESAFYIPGYGMSTAAATLAGNAYGARDNRRIKDLAKMNILLEIAMMTISGGLLFLLAPSMMGLFSKDAQVILLGTTVLRMVAVSEPFYGVSIIIEGMLQGVGKTVTPLVGNVIGMWCIRIVGTFICIFLLNFGLISAWACMIGHNLFLFGYYLFFYLSGRWNPLNQIKEKSEI